MKATLNLDLLLTRPLHTPTQAVLPTFDNPEPPHKRVGFHRLLLNKVQEEFETGIVAENMVKRREKETLGEKVGGFGV
jgi:hypothetical protein